MKNLHNVLKKAPVLSMMVYLKFLLTYGALFLFPSLLVNCKSPPTNVVNYSQKAPRGVNNTGFIQIFGSKIQDFFQTFSKTITSFSRLKVIK